LSHSRGIGMIGIADTEVGVDVETLRTFADRDAVAKRFFASGEVNRLERLAEPARQEAFFACWTRKEAYVKAIGLGLAAPLDSFEVSVDLGHPALRSVRGDRQEAMAWSLCSWRTAHAWAAAAVRKRDACFRTFHLEL
ncbi:MAG TPA: 4'-phosphopantetheinyl transferase superfamily protein, partial [Bradyrhizobium sp.]